MRREATSGRVSVASILDIPEFFFKRLSSPIQGKIALFRMVPVFHLYWDYLPIGCNFGYCLPLINSWIMFII